MYNCIIWYLGQEVFPKSAISCKITIISQPPAFAIYREILCTEAV